MTFWNVVLFFILNSIVMWYNGDYLSRTIKVIMTKIFIYRIQSIEVWNSSIFVHYIVEEILYKETEIVYHTLPYKTSQ